MIRFNRSSLRALGLGATLVAEVLVVLILLSGTGSLLGLRTNRSEASEVPEIRHVKDPVISSVNGIAEKELSLLFIGNSFIFYNDLPTMLANVASSDPDNKVKFKIYSVTRGFARLDALFKDPDSKLLMNGDRLDYVFLQQHSSWLFSKDLIADTDRSIKDWKQAAQRLGARTVFLEDWADGQKSHTYADRDSDLYGRTVTDAQTQYSEKTKEMADANQIPALLVGDYWEKARNDEDAPNLYYTDFHHPSAAGTYLTALVIYRFVTGRAPDRVSFRPAGMSDDQAQLLIAIASD